MNKNLGYGVYVGLTANFIGSVVCIPPIVVLSRLIAIDIESNLNFDNIMIFSTIFINILPRLVHKQLSKLLI